MQLNRSMRINSLGFVCECVFIQCYDQESCFPPEIYATGYRFIMLILAKCYHSFTQCIATSHAVGAYFIYLLWGFISFSFHFIIFSFVCELPQETRPNAPSIIHRNYPVI